VAMFAEVGDGDIRALAGEQHRHRAADAGIAAGDDRRHALELAAAGIARRQVTRLRIELVLLPGLRLVLPRQRVLRLPARAGLHRLLLRGLLLGGHVATLAAPMSTQCSWRPEQHRRSPPRRHDRCRIHELATCPNRCRTACRSTRRRSTRKPSTAPGTNTAIRTTAAAMRAAKRPRTRWRGRRSTTSTKRATTATGTRSRSRSGNRERGTGNWTARRSARVVLCPKRLDILFPVPRSPFPLFRFARASHTPAPATCCPPRRN